MLRDRGARLCVLLVIPVFVGAVARPCAGDEGGVTITGGVDDTGHHYTWTVSSTNPSPIIYVEIPQYRADLFTVPDGWTSLAPSETVMAARADSEASAIRPGYPGTFQMRIRAAGAGRGTGSIRVRFADGSEALVAGVAVPRPASDRFAGLIGLGGLFALWVAARALKKRRALGRDAHDADPGS